MAKAEPLEKGANPRLVVTSLSPAAGAAPALYEELYGARGEMENRIKEQLMLLVKRYLVCKRWTIERGGESSSDTP